MKRIQDTGVLLGGVALAGAVLLFGTLFVKAMTTTPVAPAAAAGTEQTVEPATEPREDDVVFPDEVLELAAQRAPFEPSRRAPARPYRMPGDPVERPQEREPEPELPPAPDFRLLATVAGADRGVAVIQPEQGPPRVLASGQDFLGYRVASIESGRAVLNGAGRTLELVVAAPAPVAIGDVSRASDRQERAIETLQSRMLDLRTRLREASGPEERMAIQEAVLETARQLQEVAQQAQERRRDRRSRGGGD